MGWFRLHNQAPKSEDAQKKRHQIFLDQKNPTSSIFKS